MLPVFFEERRVGVVHAEAAGPRFVYEESWVVDAAAFPLSVTMPLDGLEIPPERFLFWAANLLPEAEQLALVGRNLGVATTDVLGVLERIGRDTAGALSFGGPGSIGNEDWAPIDGEAELERILDELTRKPFLAGDDGVSMSLAGVQSKLTVGRDDRGALYIPLQGSPSTHILKPDSDRLYGSVQNEAFCLTLARLCGLAVPTVTTGVAGRRHYFLIERYDRRQTRQGWERIHQEDYCQVLDRPPTAKYEHNRSGIAGPSLGEMLGAVRRHALAPDILTLLDAAVFNILVCNTDAHAKNYSLILPARRRPRMAPLYDAMCAEPYEGITRNLAQTIAGKNRGDHLKRRHWLRFARDARLGPSLTIRRIEALARSVLRQAPLARIQVEAMPAGGHPLLPAIEQAVATRCRAVLEGLADHAGEDGAAD